MKKVKNRGGEESRISYFVLMVMELGVRGTISEELIECVRMPRLPYRLLNRKT